MSIEIQFFYNNSGVKNNGASGAAIPGCKAKRALRQLKIKNALNVKKRLKDKILPQVLTSNDLNLELIASSNNNS